VRPAPRRAPLLAITVLALGLAACIGEAGPASAPSHVQGLRTSDEVVNVLSRAERAYVAGEWGDAILAAAAVMEGNASPEQYYAALKILGHASCGRKDARPAVFVMSRLNPVDRDSLRRDCARQGISVE